MGNNIVPSTGSKDAKICLIGEAPGGIEDRTGVPFTGKAGKLNDYLLNLAGITRRECYITNVVKVRPYNNDISTYIKLGSSFGNAKIQDSKYKDWEEELYEELRETDCNVYVTLGSVPLYAMTRNVSSTKYRGSVLTSHPGVFEGERKVIPTIHPAAALRQYLYRYQIVHDYKLVKEHSTSPEIAGTVRDWKIARTTAEALQYIQEARQCDMVAYDIEVTNMELSCISIAKSATDVICIPFKTDSKILGESRTEPYFNPAREIQVMRGIAGLLEDESVCKLGQNLVFDASFLHSRYGIVTKNLNDTMIAQGILSPDFPKGLDFITSIYTTQPYYKDDGKKYMRLKGGNQETFWRYNALDSAVCMEAFPKLYDDVCKQGNKETYRVHVSLIEPLTYMQNRGFMVDSDGMKKESKKLEGELELLVAEFKEVCKQDINPNSSKQVIQYFYGVKGLAPYKKEGKPTADVTALIRLKRAGHHEAGILLDIRKKSKLKSSYLDITLSKGRNGEARLRSAYNPVGTETGRLSSGKNIEGGGLNMQTLPREVRKFFLADDGMLLVDIDLEQAENRVVAHIAPEPYMIQCFEEGRDVHRLTASLIFNKAEEEISDDDGSSEIGGGRFSERFWGKKANHGLNYGEGYKNFSIINEIPEAEGKEIVEGYFRSYPGVSLYHAWVQRRIESGRTLKNPFGRVRKFLDRMGHDLNKQAYAFIPQSTVADKTNRQGLLYIYYNQERFGEVEVMNQTHDSITFQLPLSMGYGVIAELINDICNELEKPLSWKGKEFSIPAGVKAGFNLGELRGLNRDSLQGDIEKLASTSIT